MTESERDPNVEWISREARRPVEMPADAKARVMDAVRRTPVLARRRRGPGWLSSHGSLARSPLGNALLAAALVGIGVLVGVAITNRDGRAPTEQRTAVAANAQLPVHDTLQVHRFELLAPHATHVALVGDFNDWSLAATPMTRSADGSAWTVTVKLPAGRHVYAFVVDGAKGSKWEPDPSALRAPDDGFGTPNSVVVIGHGSAI